MAATPDFIAQGTGFNGASSTSGVVILPANVLTNDLVILVTAHNSPAATSTYTSTYTFVEWIPPTDIGNVHHLKAYKRVCDGTESSLTVSISYAGATNVRCTAQTYLYRSTDVGAVWKHDLNGATVGEYLAVAQMTTDATKTCVGVSCSGNNRLLVNLIIFNTRQTVRHTITGTVAWTMDTILDLGLPPTYMSAHASLTTSGSVSNGVYSVSAGQIVTIATALWCSVAATTLCTSFTADGFFSSGAFGSAPIICPLGFSAETLTYGNLFVFDTYRSLPPHHRR